MIPLEAVARALFWLVVLAACAGLGRLAVNARGARRWGDLAWDAAAGLAILVGLLLAVGILPGAFRPAVLAAVLGIVLVVAVAFELIRRRRDRQTDRPTERKTAGRVACLLLICIAVVGLAWDRVPTTFFDSLAYHLAQPQLWLVEARIAPVPWLVHSWFPPGMSVLYGLGLGLGNQALAQDANLVVGLLLLALCADLASRAWGPAAGPWAVGLAVALPIVVHALGIPAADLGHGMFVLGALGAWWAAAREPDEAATWGRRSGLLAAGACLTKYLGLLNPLMLGALLLAWRERRARPVLIFVLPTVLLLGPWLIANYRVTRNPVAPALASVWPLLEMADGADEKLNDDMRGGLPDAADFRALVPRLLTSDVNEDIIYPTPAWGWALPLLVGVALFRVKDDAPTRSFLALAAVSLLLWLITYRWERFLVAPSVLLVLPAAGALASWRRLGFVPNTLAAIGVAGAVLTLPLAAASVLEFTGGGPVAVGSESPDAFFRRSLPIVRLFDVANERLDPSRDRILLLGETRHFGLTIPHAAPSVFNRHPLVPPLVEGQSAAEIVKGLRSLGYSYLLIDPGWVERSASQYPSLAPLGAHRPELAEFIRAIGPPAATDRRGRALYPLRVQPVPSSLQPG